VTSFSILLRRQARRRVFSSGAQAGSIPMRKRKGSRRASPPKIPSGVQASGSIATDSFATSGSVQDSLISKEAPASQTTASVSIIPDPTSEPESGSENNKPVNLPPPTKGSDSDSQGLEKVTPHTTASVSKLQDPTSDPTFGSENQITVATVNSAKVTLVANPENKHVCDAKEEEQGETSMSAETRVTVTNGSRPPDLGRPDSSPA
ncbi:hypothetical protein IGI04_004573, partial [Brassica rapa subsp. trilocularis]